jgi:translation initiation factor 3 subunit D
VSRLSPRDNRKHVILAVGTYKPKDFAAQMNVQLANAWGIVRAIVDICRKRPDGKYVLVKDPNKPILRFYDVPHDDEQLNGGYAEEDQPEVEGSEA